MRSRSSGVLPSEISVKLFLPFRYLARFERRIGGPARTGVPFQFVPHWRRHGQLEWIAKTSDVSPRIV
jgi:hypothetical protein